MVPNFLNRLTLTAPSQNGWEDLMNIPAYSPNTCVYPSYAAPSHPRRWRGMMVDTRGAATCYFCHIWVHGVPQLAHLSNCHNPTNTISSPVFIPLSMSYIQNSYDCIIHIKLSFLHLRSFIWTSRNDMSK